jgi:hypothetical protein
MMFAKFIVIAFAAALLALPPATLEAAEWEYEWDEGLHKEEWYDPSDWFDNDAGIDYESDWYNYTYGYNYYPYNSDGVAGYYGDDDLGYDYSWYEDGLYDYDYYTENWYEDNFTWYGDQNDVYDFETVGNTNLQKVQGTIKEMKDFKLGGMEQKNMFAKLETQDGRNIRVDLGPLSESRKSKIKTGDQITVFGTEGSVNDRPMFMALSIKSQSGEEKVERQYDQKLKKLQAKVLNTRTADFKKKQNTSEQVFARVDLKEGPTTVLNLGPKKNLPDNLDLKGKQVAILARPVKIGDKMALVAEEIHADGKTINIEHATLPKDAAKKSTQKNK